MKRKGAAAGQGLRLFVFLFGLLMLIPSVGWATDYSITVDNVSGNEDTAGNLIFTVSITPAVQSGDLVSVDYATADVSATDGTDYSGETGTLSFSAGDASKTVSVTVSADSAVEGDEEFNFDLTNALVTPSLTNTVTIASSTGTGTIVNDDTATLSISSDGAKAENAGPASFTVSSGGVTVEPSAAVVVSYSVTSESGDTATADSDYSSTSSGSFAFSGTSATITVSLIDDGNIEGDETFSANLTGSTNTSVNASASTKGVITDDGDSATLTIVSDGTVAEDSGPSTFTVSSGGVTVEDSANLTVSYSATSVAGDTALAGIDYADTTTGSISFSGTSASINVPLVDDANVEGDETFTVSLTGASDSDVTASAGVQGTISDDGDSATLTIVSDGTVAEDSGPSTFTVSSGGVTVEDSANLTVSYSATSVAGDTALAGIDYADTSTGSISFSGTSASISVPLVDDANVEGDETFTVSLTGASDSDVTASASVQGTISDDGDSATLTIVSDGTVAEDSGPSTFTVSSGGVTVEDSANLIVSYSATSVAGDTALAGIDYADTTTGSISFSGTSASISVPLVDDTNVEGDETFTVSLTGASDSDVTASASVQGTISDDGDSATLTIVSDESGSEGAGSLTFTVTSDSVVESSAAVSVSYSASSESGDTATADSDYTSTTTGSIPFSGTSGSISIPLTDDGNVEGDETFTLTLTGSTTPDITAADTARGTITDNDTANLTINDVSVSEGNGSVTLTVTSDKPIESSTTVTVDFSTQDNTAVAGEDYSASSGTLNMTDSSTGTLTIPVLEDSPSVVEGDETFNVLLANASSKASISDATGIVTVNDNDVPTLSIDDVAMAEGDGTDTSVTFTVTSSLAVAANATLSFDYTVNALTTEAGDFSGATSGSGTITNGNTGTVSLLYTADQVVETDEDYTVALSNATIKDSANVPTFSDDSGAGVIKNDDSPQLAIGDVALSEGDSGTVTADFTVTSDLQVAPDAAVTFDYVVTPVDTEGSDLSGSLSGNMTITNGNTVQIPVDLVGDVTVETDETYTVDLSNASVPASTVGASFSDDSGLGTILNDDYYTVSIESTLKSALEDQGPLTWTVTLSNPVEWQVDVPYTFNAASTDTAVEGGDYNDADSSPLTFDPGTTSQNITINLVNDTVIEPDETFTITLSAPSPGTSGSLGSDQVGTGEILNDEHLITMSAGAQGTLSTTYDGTSVTNGSGRAHEKCNKINQKLKSSYTSQKTEPSVSRKSAVFETMAFSACESMFSSPRDVFATS